MIRLNVKPGERLHVAPDVWVQVEAVGNGEVQVGIETPGRFRIYRESALKKAIDEHAEYGGHHG